MSLAKRPLTLLRSNPRTGSVYAKRSRLPSCACNVLTRSENRVIRLSRVVICRSNSSKSSGENSSFVIWDLRSATFLVNVFLEASNFSAEFPSFLSSFSTVYRKTNKVELEKLIKHQTVCNKAARSTFSSFDKCESFIFACVTLDSAILESA